MIFIKRISLLVTFVLLALSILAGCLADYEPHYRVDFVARACIKPHHRYYYRTCNELVAKVNSDIVAVPADFNTDLASIPKWLWSFISPQYSAFVMPAILHDYLYACPGNIPRKTMDDILYSALISEGVTKFTASKMWLAVRIFGAKNFNGGLYCRPDGTNSSRYDFGLNYNGV